MSRISAPNYTQMPNVLLDHMAEMGNAELRIIMAIARKTFGWQKCSDRISLSQLVELTGLSRQGVIDGTAQAVENGWATKTECGNSFEYSLLLEQLDEPASQASRPEMVKPVDQLLVKLVDTQKKELNKKETTDSRKRESPTRNPDLLITTIQHGEELQALLTTAFESQNRKAPLYFENVLQKDAFADCAKALNGRFIEAATSIIQRGRTGRGDILASLKQWEKNEAKGNRTYARTEPQAPGNTVSDEGLEWARRMSRMGNTNSNE